MMDFSFHARIIDFGLSGLIGQKYYGNIKIGTRQYRAPEA
jgi:serine/threonine protein kinase